jgi:uncharacterized membrane protein
MKTKHFLNALDGSRIAEAIRSAESRTSGEIRVFVSSRRKAEPVMERAARRFEKLGMTKTREHNGVLVYLVPETREFAIIGDSGIHETCGEGFWSDIAAGLRRTMAKGDFTGAIIEAVSAVGDALASHFPRRTDDQNELPDSIGRD